MDLEMDPETKAALDELLAGGEPTTDLVTPGEQEVAASSPTSTSRQDPVQETDRLGNSTMSTADLRHGSKTSRQHAVDFATNIFAAVDKNGDGTLTKTEIRKYFKANPEDKYVKAN